MPRGSYQRCGYRRTSQERGLWFHKLLLNEIREGGHARLGDAVLKAQQAYVDSGALPELVTIYHLLKDPTLPIR